MRPVQFLQLSLSLMAAWLVLSQPAEALAAEPSASEISVARRLFEEGAALENEGKWPQAAEKFRRAAAIKDTPGIRFHLARCEEERGALVEALLEYDRARELIERGAKAPDVEKLLGPARERVQARVALLTLRLPSDVSHVMVEVDGKPLSSSVRGLPLPLNPGKHRLTAAASGRKTHTEEVELGAGESRELRIVLPPAPAPVPAPGHPSGRVDAPPRSSEAATAGGGSARTITLASEASVFAIGLGAGIAFSVARGSAQDRFERANARVLASVGSTEESATACNPPPKAGCAELEHARAERDRASALSAAGFIGAGVSAAAFGLTWWLWPKRSEPTVRLGALASPDGFRLSLTARL